MSSPVTTSPFMQTTRKFPLDPNGLQKELVKFGIDVANTVNNRDISSYDLTAIANGQLWFSTSTTEGSSSSQKRQAQRQVYQFGAIAAGASSSVSHGITALSTFTRIYGTCITATVDYRPLPYASVTANANIELLCTATQITINVGAASPNVTSAIVVLEWLAT